MAKQVVVIDRRSGNVAELRLDQASASLPAGEGATVRFAVSRSQVVGTERSGQDLVISFADGTTVRITGYFACAPESRSEIVFAEPGAEDAWQAVPGGEACYAMGDAGAETLALQWEPVPAFAEISPSAGAEAGAAAGAGAGAGAGVGGWVLPAALVGLGGVGAVAAAGGGGGGDSKSETPPPNETPEPADTTPPPAPTVEPSNGKTFTGTAEAGSTVGIDTNGDGKAELTTTADASGNWTIEATEPVPDGTVVWVTATDAAGNVSADTAIAVDGAAPVISIAAVDGNDAVITPDEAAEGLTLLGTTSAEDGQPITVSFTGDGGTVTVTTAASIDGWSVSLTPEQLSRLGTGRVQVSAKVADAVGNEATPARFEFFINDGSPLATPTITAVRDNAGSTDGSGAESGITNDPSPAILGTLDYPLDAGETLIVCDAETGVELGVATVWGQEWSFEDRRLLDDGQVARYHAYVVNEAGQKGAVSNDYAVELVLSPPMQIVTLTGISEDTGVVHDLVTADQTLVLTGTLSAVLGPDKVLNVFDGDGNLLGQASVSGLNWTFDDTGRTLSAGLHRYTLRVDGADGTKGVETNVDVTVDPTAPASIITIDAVMDDVGVATGAVPDGGVTDDTYLTLNGSLSAPLAVGEVVRIYDGTVYLGQAIVSGTSWTFEDLRMLAHLQNVRYTAQVVDLAGNAGAASDPYSVTISLYPPRAPRIDAVEDDVGVAQGSLGIGAATDDTRPTISGSNADPGVQVNIYGNGTLIGTTTADGDGRWSFTPSAPLADGNYSITASVTDAVGVEGLQSWPREFTVDTIKPLSPTGITLYDDVGPVTGPITEGGVTDDTTLIISGKAEAGTQITIYNNGTQVLGYAGADATGVWNFLPSKLLDGDYSITATARDEAYNVSAASDPITFTVNTGTPAYPPVIAEVIDDVGPSTGAVSHTGATNDTLPTLHGTSALLTGTVSVYDNGVFIGSTTIDASGEWSFTPSTPLSDGEHEFTVRNVGLNGREGPLSSEYKITVDTLAPGPLTILDVVDDIAEYTGPIPEGGLTNDNFLAINGSGAEPYASVRLYNNGTFLISRTADAAGNWSFEGYPMPDGTHSITVSAVDAAGNEGPQSAARTFTIDTVDPTWPLLTDVSGNAGSGGSSFTTSDTTPLFSGTTEAGASVELFLDGASIGTITADGAGNWSLEYTDAVLPDGTYILTMQATDAAGNTTGLAGHNQIIIDTTSSVLAFSSAGAGGSEPLSGGSAGADTLMLAAGGPRLDFSAIDQTAVPGADDGDLSASRADTPSLAAEDVLDMSGPNDPLILTGDADDGVTNAGIADTGSGSSVGSESYAVYGTGDAALWVDQTNTMVAV